MGQFILEQPGFQLHRSAYMQSFSVNTVNAPSLHYDFHFFLYKSHSAGSLLYYNIVYNTYTYKINVKQLFMLSVKLPVISRLLLLSVFFWGGGKVMCVFLTMKERGDCAPYPHVFQGQLYYEIVT